MTTPATVPVTAEPAGTSTKYNPAIGYLRAFVVALVVAHHSMLAYYQYAPPPATSLVAQPRWWEAFPVVDTQRWSGFSVLIGFNDVFFMSLLFFVSGLFVWQGLRTKGGAKFLRGRLLRLGVPFVVACAVVAPVAYYPTYLRATQHSAGFVREWLSLGQWPAGPAWFIWVLLAFDGIAALLFAVMPKWGSTIGRIMPDTPGKFFGMLAAISAVAYIPMAVIFTSLDWSSFGPFAFQTSRILHYLVYFLVGVGVGAMGVEQGLLATGGRLARRWGLWVMRGLGAFGAASVVTIVALTSHATSRGWGIAIDAGFVISCAASCFLFLAVFTRFARGESRIFDSLAQNSYGIYLVHYAFVSWLQYALLPASVPALLKGLFVFVGALGLSWGMTAVIRRIPAVAQVV